MESISGHARFCVPSHPTSHTRLELMGDFGDSTKVCIHSTCVQSDSFQLRYTHVRLRFERKIQGQQSDVSETRINSNNLIRTVTGDGARQWCRAVPRHCGKRFAYYKRAVSYFGLS